MGLFNKKQKDIVPEPEVIAKPSFSYPIEIKFWNDHKDAILQIIDKCDLNEMEGGKYNAYLRCSIVPEPDNKFDSNALKVFAGVKGTKTQDLCDIGYIPSEFTQTIKEDNEKVVLKSHFWSLRMIVNVFDGVRFLLSLKESKF